MFLITQHHDEMQHDDHHSCAYCAMAIDIRRRPNTHAALGRQQSQSLPSRLRRTMSRASLYNPGIVDSTPPQRSTRRPASTTTFPSPSTSLRAQLRQAWTQFRARRHPPERQTHPTGLSRDLRHFTGSNNGGPVDGGLSASDSDSTESMDSGATVTHPRVLT